MSQVVVPHPAKGELAMRRITNRDIARRFGYHSHYVGRILNGWLPASARFRADIAGLLEMPEGELFHPAPRHVGAAS